MSNCIFCGRSTVSISVTQSEPSDPVYKDKQKLTLNCSIRKTTLMSNLLDIDFVIKLNAKRSRRFDLSEAIFKCK